MIMSDHAWISRSGDRSGGQDIYLLFNLRYRFVFIEVKARQQEMAAGKNTLMEVSGRLITMLWLSDID